MGGGSDRQAVPDVLPAGGEVHASTSSDVQRGGFRGDSQRGVFVARLAARARRAARNADDAAIFSPSFQQLFAERRKTQGFSEFPALHVGWILATLANARPSAARPRRRDGRDLPPVGSFVGDRILC